MSELKYKEIGFNEQIQSGGPDSILAHFFKVIIFNLKMDMNGFFRLIDRFIISINGITLINEISTARSALRRELMSQTMTWNVFLKGLLFLRIKEARIELVLFREGEETSVHEHIVQITNIKEIEDEERINDLSIFFKTIVEEDLKIDKDLFKQLLDRYVWFSKPGSSDAEKHSAKCSLKRELYKNSISWKVFVKGLILLKTTRMIIRITLTSVRGTVSVHKHPYIFK